MRDIVHIGFQKAASSWLQEHVFPRCARRVYLRPVRALRELTTVDEAGAAVARLEALLAEAASPVILSHEMLCGHVFQGSEHRTRTALRLRTVLRDPVVLVVLRAQPTMLVSLYGQYLNQGGTARFDDFLASRAAGLRFDPAHLEYDWLIERYVEVFGEDRVVALAFEQLACDREGFCARVAEVLGDAVPADLPASANPSGSAWAMDMERRANRAFRRSSFNPAPLLRVPGAHAVRRVAQAIPHGTSMWERHGELATAFASRYRSGNARLGALVPWDPTAFGYPV